MRKMRFPSWLYELRPVLYLLAGALMLGMFGDELLGVLSGFLLIAAAGVITLLRLHARKRTPRER